VTVRVEAFGPVSLDGAEGQREVHLAGVIDGSRRRVRLATSGGAVAELSWRHVR
jgi:hypothetical protein